MRDPGGERVQELDPVPLFALLLLLLLLRGGGGASAGSSLDVVDVFVFVSRRDAPVPPHAHVTRKRRGAVLRILRRDLLRDGRVVRHEQREALRVRHEVFQRRVRDRGAVRGRRASPELVQHHERFFRRRG
eukprot:30968-Pelagococcus_subviridis.AAC.7